MPLPVIDELHRAISRTFSKPEPGPSTRELDEKYAARAGFTQRMTVRDDVLSLISRFGVTRDNAFAFELLKAPAVTEAVAAKVGIDSFEYKLVAQRASRLTSGIYCVSSSFPSVSVEVQESYVVGKPKKYATRRRFDQLQAGFLDDAEGSLRRFFFWWTTLIDQNTVTQYRLYPSEYYGEIAISSLDAGLNKSATLVLRNAFPVQVGDLSFDSSQESSIARFTVSFDYERAEYVTPDR